MFGRQNYTNLFSLPCTSQALLSEDGSGEWPLHINMFHQIYLCQRTSAHFLRKVQRFPAKAWDPGQMSCWCLIVFLFMFILLFGCSLASTQDGFRGASSASRLALSTRYSWSWTPSGKCYFKRTLCPKDPSTTLAISGFDSMAIIVKV